MSAANHYPVVIIGAGMAGLAAATELHDAGISVVVLENKQFPGGRTHTIKLPDKTIIPTGAGFMMTSYRNTRALIKRLGLATYPLHKMEAQILSCGSYHLLSDHNPLQILRTDILTTREKLSAAASLLQLLPSVLKANIYQPETLLEFDTQSTYRYVSKHFSPKFAKLTVDPLVYSIFGYSSKEISFAFLLAAFRETFGHHHFGLVGGIDKLAKSLAAELPMRYGIEVEKVLRSDKKIILQTNHGSLSTDHVIIAVPGSKVERLLGNAALKMEKDFFADVLYKPEQFFLVKTSTPLPGGKHSLFPESGGHKICSVIEIEDYAEARKENCHYYNIALREPITDFSSAKQEKVAAFAEIWDQYFSNYDYELMEIIEWENTLPVFYPGYLRKVYAFNQWQLHKSDGRIMYAGDYLQAPYIEGAVTSGQSVAAALAKRLSFAGIG
jgi:oxygen-dependent protoporphyrinogen oxidase